MKTVLNNTNTLIIKKSKFITFIYNVSNKTEITNYLIDITNKYSDSTHICYAYIIDNDCKYFDDKEPNGTAGSPILNILKKEDVNNVLCIVVRYFGGIKLGASGLIRAYSNACKECLKTTNLDKGYEIKITFNYNSIKQIDYLLKNSIIKSKSFDNKTTYDVYIKESEYNLIIEPLKKLSKIEIIKHLFI